MVRVAISIVALIAIGQLIAGIGTQRSFVRFAPRRVAMRRPARNFDKSRVHVRYYLNICCLFLKLQSSNSVCKSWKIATFNNSALEFQKKKILQHQAKLAIKQEFGSFYARYLDKPNFNIKSGFGKFGISEMEKERERESSSLREGMVHHEYLR